MAGMIVQQAAISAFPLGAGLGALWDGMFPVDAGRGLLAITMGAVFLSGAVLAAFSGIVTDPLQRSLGLHRRRLTRLLREIEGILCAERKRNSATITSQGLWTCSIWLPSQFGSLMPKSSRHFRPIRALRRGRRTAITPALWRIVR